MKLFCKNSVATVFVIFLMLGLAGPMVAQAATLPPMGAAASFSVLAALSMSAAAPGTTVSGDLGLSTNVTSSRTGNWTVNGTEYFGPSSLAATANTAAVGAFNNLAGQGTNGVWSSATPTPGVWTIAADQTFTGTLTLNGGYNDVWVFQIGNDMTFSGSVVLTGNVQPCHVFWQIGRDATIAASSHFVGTLIASRDVTVVSGATVNGRIISLTSSLTTDGNAITGPTCAAAPLSTHLIVIKHVINDNGGLKHAVDFSTTISGVTTAVPTAAGVESPGVDNVLTSVGAYSVDEGAHVGYTKTLSADCSSTIVLGDTKTCTITNDDILALPATSTINVVKTVVNLYGGSKVPANFPLFVNGTPVTSGVTNVFPTSSMYTVTETSDPNYTAAFSGDCDSSGHLSLASGENKICFITNSYNAPSGGGSGSAFVAPVPPLIDVVKVPSPLALPAGPGMVTYSYTLRNIGTVPVTNVTMIDDSCSPVTLVSGDTNSDAKLDVNETWKYTCSATISATHTNTVVATGWANGISATDVANATVVVGAPVVPPLIHVTKIPSPLTLPASGGMVTYTKKVTNPGTVALSNVILTDDKCNPVKYISGDTNGDSKLDPSETWTYTCTTKLTKTTVNTVIATGEANGLTARDFAIATVVVPAAVPKLPNTGLAPEEKNTPWNIAIPVGILVLVSTSLAVVIRKRTI